MGFFTIIVQPTFSLLAELQSRVKEQGVLSTPKRAQDVMLTHLHTNTEAWEARKKKEQPGGTLKSIENRWKLMKIE